MHLSLAKLQFDHRLRTKALSSEPSMMEITLSASSQSAIPLIAATDTGLEF